MKKYSVYLEFKVKSIDLMEIEVEASSREEAIKKAYESYDNDPNQADLYASDYYECEIDSKNMNLVVEEVE